jgi:hypothetical protein
MSLDTYTGLKDVILAYVKDSGGLEERIPDCIAQAEARFRRVLVMPEQETQLTIPAASPTTLPDDFDSIRNLTVLGGGPVQPTSPAEFYSLSTTAAGQPARYTVIGNTLLLWPTPDTDYNALLTYRAKLPSLSDTVPTNWLLASHPDLYLKASLAEAELYGWNDERVPGLVAWVDGVLEELRVAGQRKRYSGGPLVMRPSVGDVSRRHQYSGSVSSGMTDGVDYLEDG